MEIVHILMQMGVSLLIVEGLMILFWVIYLFNDRVKIVDIAWGLSFAVATTCYYIMGEGYVWRKILILSLVIIWSMRLVYHLVQRFDFDKDDPRYVEMLDPKGGGFLGKIKSIGLRVLTLFLVQGLIVVILSIPFALMSNNAFFYFKTTEIFGLLVWVVGMIGESVADEQLYRFKQDPMKQTLVCEEGLWKYSRHPNYFFEWIIWIGYWLMALSAPWGVLGIISPVLIFYLLLKVSGVPLAEREALRSKGEAYKDYQNRVSMFFPWFRG